MYTRLDPFILFPHMNVNTKACRKLINVNVANFFPTQYKIQGYPLQFTRKFAKTCTQTKDGRHLLQLLLSAGAKQKRGVHQYIKENQHREDFQTVIPMIEKVWKRNNEWDVRALTMAGQCIFETGFGNYNDMIFRYRRRIGCNSNFSEALDIKRVPIKARVQVLESRKKITADCARTAGEYMLDFVKVQRQIIQGSIEQNKQGDSIIVRKVRTDVHPSLVKVIK